MRLLGSVLQLVVDSRPGSRVYVFGAGEPHGVVCLFGGEPMLQSEADPLTFLIQTSISVVQGDGSGSPPRFWIFHSGAVYE